MKRLLLAPLLLGFIPFANANVDPEIHKLCIPATDYLGCVKAMTTKSTDIPSMRMIDGGVELSGNSCPINYAYIGGGNCREVLDGGWYTPTFFGLLSAGWQNSPALLGDWSLKLGESSRAVIDKNCPIKEPYIYTNSSCDPKPKPPSDKILKKYSRGITRKQREALDKGLFKIFGIPNMTANAFNKKEKPPKTDVYSGSVKINCNSSVWRDKPRCN